MTEVKRDTVKSAIPNRRHHQSPCLHVALATAIATTLKQPTPIKFHNELGQTISEILEL